MGIFRNFTKLFFWGGTRSDNLIDWLYSVLFCEEGGWDTQDPSCCPHADFCTTSDGAAAAYSDNDNPARTCHARTNPGGS